jgi:hypothetical protein
MIQAIGQFIKENSQTVARPPHIAFWVEEESSDKARGLAIARDYSEVGNVLFRYYEGEGPPDQNIKEWSADEIAILECPDIFPEAGRSIFDWKVIFDKPADVMQTRYRNNPSPDETITEALELLKAGYLSPQEMFNQLTPNLIETTKYINNLIQIIDKFIKENGLVLNVERAPTPSLARGAEAVYLWIQEESQSPGEFPSHLFEQVHVSSGKTKVKGLAIARSRADVGNALQQYYADQNIQYLYREIIATIPEMNNDGDPIRFEYIIEWQVALETPNKSHYRRNISDEELEYLKQQANLGDPDALQQLIDAGIDYCEYCEEFHKPNIIVCENCDETDCTLNSSPSCDECHPGSCYCGKEFCISCLENHTSACQGCHILLCDTCWNQCLNCGNTYCLNCLVWDEVSNAHLCEDCVSESQTSPENV